MNDDTLKKMYPSCSKEKVTPQDVWSSKEVQTIWAFYPSLRPNEKNMNQEKK